MGNVFYHLPAVSSFSNGGCKISDLIYPGKKEKYE